MLAIVANGSSHPHHLSVTQYRACIGLLVEAGLGPRSSYLSEMVAPCFAFAERPAWADSNSGPNSKRVRASAHGESDSASGTAPGSLPPT
jgi:hypothetical protein